MYSARGDDSHTMYLTVDGNDFGIFRVSSGATGSTSTSQQIYHTACLGAFASGSVFAFTSSSSYDIRYTFKYYPI